MSTQDIPATQQQGPRPDVIYHYCSMESFIKIIENKELWLSSSTQTNDIAECRWLFSLVVRYVQENFSNSPEDIQFANSMLDMIALNSSPSYIACFSQDMDRLSQWRCYADEGKGVAIGFKLSSFENTLIGSVDFKKFPRQDKYYLCKVIYANYGTVSPMIQLLIDQAKNCSDPHYDIGIIFSKLRTLFKNDSFSEENEWRFAVDPYLSRKSDANIWLSTLPMEIFRTRLTAKGLSRYIAYPILGAGQPQIAEIVLGPQNPTSELDLSFFLFKNGLPLVEIGRSSSTFRG